MTLVERLSLKLTEEQRERFIILIEANPDVPPQEFFKQIRQEQE